MSTPDELLALLDGKALGFRPQRTHGHEGVSIVATNGEVLNHEQRTAMDRFEMLDRSGHRCFCTALDIPGLGRPCCATGLTLPMSTRAEFKADGGDVGAGAFGESRPQRPTLHLVEGDEEP